MDEKAINEQAVKLRREYQREWRKRNKDKVAANNRRYWERKAQKMAQMAEKMEVKERWTSWQCLRRSARSYWV